MKKTISTIFFAPTVINVEAAKNNGFLNAYVQDKTHEAIYPNAIYLLFKPSNIDKFRDFLENEYERGSTIIEDYDYPEGYIVLVYQLDMTFRKDIDLVKRGQYSKTSEDFQALFPEKKKKLIEGKWENQMTVQHRIFKKTEDFVEYWEEKLGVKFDNKMEVWRGWEEEEEILDMTKIKELV